MTSAGTADWDMFRDITAITRWIDAASSGIPGDDAMRILKLAEECGEAAAAYIGATGQNPRKGVTHTMSEVCMELADVAITALCAISHYNDNSPEIVRAYLAAKITEIIGRADIPREIRINGS